MDLSKTYDFSNTEERIYKMWEDAGYFKPTNDPSSPDHDPSIKPFVISIPPPNVTGELHLGHALFVSMEDLMIRYHRMKGIPALWIPGTDHAGIATQLQVEKLLMRTEGITREEIGREEFIKRTWQWKEKYGSQITQQIRRLGASCDWDRERFTLDEGLSKAVREAFVTLYQAGKIYRGPRLINWSPGLKTAVSDLEVEYHEESGKLYFFKYFLKNSEEFIPVATTRPETILGDTAVAVHPDDDRYKSFIGKTVLVPMLGREIPVIADEYVDKEFGTGALKITPGHDPNDYEIGNRHNLPVVSILDKQAKINENGGKYKGMDRIDCRKAIWADMEENGLVIKTEPHLHQVPRSQRGGEIIEPMISTQWFVKTEGMGEAALAAVKNGNIKIVPDFFNKTYNNWMENLTDWCISRQLWWGHRIPVWYGPDNEMFCARTEDEALSQANLHYGEPTELTQDPDVLDTWFSSGLWPFSTLGWPDKTPDLAYYYPTSILETGYDILFFWVARMIMSGLEYTDTEPFHTVYLHGIIRDENGKKMSKTTGNVIDPLIVMDELGTDALRFTLLVGSSPGKDMNLSTSKVEANRNFANKIWNATRLVLSLIENSPTKGEIIEDSPADAWIKTRLSQLIFSVEKLFGNHLYGEAGKQIYEFFRGDFADWYLEIAKLQVREGGHKAWHTSQIIIDVLDTSLRLLHPFTPFVTEELWQSLKTTINSHGINNDWADALIIAQWPEAKKVKNVDEKSITDFQAIQEVVRAIRNLRADKQVKPGLKIPATIIAGEFSKVLDAQKKSIAAMAHLDLENLEIHSEIKVKPQNQISLVAGTIEIYIPLSGMVDLKEEKQRLEKSLAENNSHIERLSKLLNSPFGQNAPEAVVSKEKEKLANYQTAANKIQKQISEIAE
jgi:valyl-tRNA synthetase